MTTQVEVGGKTVTAPVEMTAGENYTFIGGGDTVVVHAPLDGGAAYVIHTARGVCPPSKGDIVYVGENMKN